MILVALGANVDGPWGTPVETVNRALRELDRGDLRLVAASRLIETTPFGRSNQPNFVNAVARIETHLPPQALMLKLHAIEHAAGRRRAVRWGPRTLDLDLLDYHGLVRDRAKTPGALHLPHPGIAERLFVLVPLTEIAPDWRHPSLHMRARQLLRRLRRAHPDGGSEIAH